ncbi:MAG: hypothetical protein OMM_09438 [Candidatus Magnetoglobus multicellularis str. Araruama]|uniref:Uncharacterized protein n=1 Tax=Candidatus Magnetoglobus multicellularis str. Araruama TaxID=890399 RepID=A0A1V1P490_9BACT|nr:MAG: hypothetical protein OMM_09438 [Candidatus Magnetoglobus multicellularis str. Araruama]
MTQTAQEMPELQSTGPERRQKTSRSIYRWLFFCLIPLVCMGIVWLVARLCILPQVDFSILQMPTQIQQNITPANDNHPELETIHITINDVPKNIVQPTFYQKYGLAIKWLSMIFPLVFFSLASGCGFKDVRLFWNSRNGKKRQPNGFRPNLIRQTWHSCEINVFMKPQHNCGKDFRVISGNWILMPQWKPVPAMLRQFYATAI